MEITALEGMDLVSMSWTNSRFELRAVDASGALWEATLTNPDQALVEVNVRSLSLRLIYDEEGGNPTLGELETITVAADQISFEADAGEFCVRAERVFVQELKGAGHGRAA